ncbi:hypothetical protein M1N55_06535 [Dehalococcoidia bacterium]|nr:hypothetical protein [Dehalococcoidia bacterium]
MMINNNDSKKKQQFRKLAEIRMTNALRDLRLIGNLADTRNYGINPDESIQMIGALQKALHEVRKKFSYENNDVTDKNWKFKSK